MSTDPMENPFRAYHDTQLALMAKMERLAARETDGSPGAERYRLREMIAVGGCVAELGATQRQIIANIIERCHGTEVAETWRRRLREYEACAAKHDNAMLLAARALHELGEVQ